MRKIKKNYSKWLFASSIIAVITALCIATTTKRSELIERYEDPPIAPIVKKNKEQKKYLSETETSTLSSVVIDGSKHWSVTIIFDEVKKISLVAKGKYPGSSIPDISKIPLSPKAGNLIIDLDQSLKDRQSYYGSTITITLPINIETLKISSSKLSRYKTKIVGIHTPQKLSISNAISMDIHGTFNKVDIVQITNSHLSYNFNDASITDLKLQAKNTQIHLHKEFSAEKIRLITNINSTLSIYNMELLKRTQWQQK